MASPPVASDAQQRRGGDALVLAGGVAQFDDRRFARQQVAEAAVADQVGRRFGAAVRRQIARRGAQHAAQGDQLAGDGIVRRQAGMAQGEVDVAVDQVVRLVVEHQFAFQFRVAFGEPGEQGGDVQAAEGDRGADAEQAARRVAEVAQGDAAVGQRRQRAQGVRVKGLAGRRQAQGAGRALEEAHAEFAFEFGDLLADLRPRAVQAAGGGGHAAVFDGFDEAFPGGECAHVSMIR